MQNNRDRSATALTHEQKPITPADIEAIASTWHIDRRRIRCRDIDNGAISHQPCAFHVHRSRALDDTDDAYRPAMNHVETRRAHSSHSAYCVVDRTAGTTHAIDTFLLCS